MHSFYTRRDIAKRFNKYLRRIDKTQERAISIRIRHGDTIDK